jgi:subtilisin family serine protease
MQRTLNRLLTGILLAAALALAACAPTVNFSGPPFQDLGTAESSYTVAVGMSGGFLAGADWSATASHAWIGVSPASGSGAATVIISVDRSALHPDTQINSGTVSFTSTTGASFTTRLLFRFEHAEPNSIRGRLFPGGTAQSASTVPVTAASAATLQTLPLAAPAPGPEWVEGEVLVIPAVSDLHAFARSLGASDRDVSPAGFVRVPTLPGESVPAAVQRLLARADVAHAQPNYLYRALGPTTGSTNDPFFEHQWNLWSTRVSCQGSDACADAAWLIEGGETAIRVAVLDTGILPAHEERTDPGANPIVDGYDFVNNDSDPTAIDDGTGAGYHGQFVAGVIGAASNNAKGIAGAARAVTIVPVRVLNSSGSGSTSNIAEGIRYAAGLDNSSGTTIVRAHVINLSLGAPGISDTVLENAVNAAHAAGTVLIAASGNDGDEPVFVPAQYANTVAVGSVDLNSAGTAFSRSGFSSYGPELDLVAPGGTHQGTTGCGGDPTRIIGPWTESIPYACGEGTSFSTPLVSAAAALVLALEPGLGPEHIRGFLRNYTQNLDRSENTDCATFTNETGCGVLDAFRTIAVVAGDSEIEVVLEDEAGTIVAGPVAANGAGVFEFAGLIGPGPYRVIARRVSDSSEVGRYFRPDRVILVTPGESGVNFGIDGSLF